MLRHVAVKDARFGHFTFMRASAFYLRGRSQSRDSTNGKRTRTRTRGAMESDLAAPTEAVAVAPEPIAGVKRPLEEPSAPEGSPPAADAAPASEAAPVATGAPPVAALPVATPTSLGFMRALARSRVLRCEGHVSELLGPGTANIKRTTTTTEHKRITPVTQRERSNR